jgi:hypothetical protein
MRCECENEREKKDKEPRRLPWKGMHGEEWNDEENGNSVGNLPKKKTSRHKRCAET